ncbi:class-II fumarase/aspartase family protein [Brachybacterium hainanense]|uniref:Adenylosuccinate lyase family protein n=1 Tax=Brachybacterium hainanense TaxID=1541174 RepID=A0ABV6REJ9_9MICO
MLHIPSARGASEMRPGQDPAREPLLEEPRMSATPAPTHIDLPELFTRRATLERWLAVEAALSRAQAAHGVIPAQAADRIEACANLGSVDIDEVTRRQSETGHTMMGLVLALSDAVGDEHGGWVHWGATTQNVEQTAHVLAVRDAHVELLARLGRVLAALASLAEEHAETTMAGRTHWRQALPITFGYKVSAWIDALLRSKERMAECEKRLFTAMAGGAVGTFASMGPIGPAVQDEFAARLGLRPMPVPNRSLQDPFAEYVGILALLCASLTAIGDEIALLMSDEFDELAEPTFAGQVGSSTMPQKRNPGKCGEITIVASQVMALVPLALQGVQHSHEVEGARSVIVERAVEQAIMGTGRGLTLVAEVLEGLEVRTEAMTRNLEISRGLIVAEALMLGLAGKTGRQRAHHLVHEIAERSQDDGRPFDDALRADPRVAELATPEELERWLDPSQYSGLSADIARSTAARAREAIERNGESPC